MRQVKFWFTVSGIQTLLVMVFMLSTLAMAATKYKVLHGFNGKDGKNPEAPVIFDSSGNLYGTTFQGGGCGGSVCGTVFELTPNTDGTWTETVLYHFTGGSDGAGPVAGLIFDTAGNLFGTTSAGGCNGNSCGTVFELTPNKDGTWAERVLHAFCSTANCSDGNSPRAGLVLDQAGNLYGMTPFGGSFGNGVVFKLTPHSDGSWTETVLHNFTGGSDGAGPVAGLTLDGSGNLYGTTSGGGNLSFCNGGGCGVVFKLTANGDGSWKEKVIHKFTGIKDGIAPQSDLIFDAAGNIYGTTGLGGNSTCESSSGCGLVFKLTPNSDGSWKEKVLHRFVTKSGAYPQGALALDGAGNLYGTTQVAAGAKGVVFKLTPTTKGGWTDTVLLRFSSSTVGAYPYAGVILDTSSNLYGTTVGCGNPKVCQGLVFEITP
jgi:uncharacterized repeat protein (TIGR03803 family)